MAEAGTASWFGAFEDDRLVSSLGLVRRLVMVADPDYLAIRIYRALGFTDGETQVQLTRTPTPSS